MKTVFLDRDGVINENHLNRGYVCTWSDFVFINNSLEAISILSQNGFRIYIVTNQSGIARGFFTEKQLSETHARMIDAIQYAGGHIEKIYYCPHHPDDDCECRKPKPGMLHQAAKDNNIDLSVTYFIGDSSTDIEAAAAVGAIPFLVLTGHGHKTYKAYDKDDNSNTLIKPLKVFTNLYTASKWLVLSQHTIVGRDSEIAPTESWINIVQDMSEKR
ncbi:D-glycero-beta-D-manno-heptose 1,7-bisphosphate 7-phosphatase [Candidatus Poribacteria bacterium]|nr:D-glycero-beta-D-manno-heptose 1,7-bisphosphate 7-phosphatase [Candidatus Poribacteria bacterium]MYI94155.1 D-glycero-beta-D-manno-heptose 1,7-bisphosphate 7-phosphatase [Candidatus Poribacteria bacterium]